MPAESGATRVTRGPRWLAAGVFALLLPKCLLCVGAYLGGGATLGWTTRELCGTSGPSVPLALGGLLLAGAVGGVLAWGVRRRLGRDDPGALTRPEEDSSPIERDPDALAPRSASPDRGTPPPRAIPLAEVRPRRGCCRAPPPNC